MSSVKSVVRGLVPQRLRKAILVRKYAGDRYTCPCCGMSFRTFWPSGVNEKPNTMCPGCGSLERHRLLWLYLKERPELFGQPCRMLHVAPEPLFESYFRSVSSVDYLSADLESPSAMEKMDLTDIQFPDGAFDAIVCCHVLEHIPDDRKAMRELRRVLRPGGWAILQVPIGTGRASTYEDFSITAPADRLRLFGQEDHVRVYGRDYEERLTEAGFAVKVDGFGHERGPEYTDRYRLQDDEDVYLCIRPGDIQQSPPPGGAPGDMG